MTEALTSPASQPGPGAGHPALRLAIVLSHPNQYYSPWFRWLRRHTGLAFRVFYLWDFGVEERRDPQFQTSFRWDIDLLSGYDHEFVPNRARRPGAEHFFGFRNPALPSRLEAWRPGALLIFGYRFDSHLRAIAWARRRRIPLLFRGDSHRLGRGRPGPLARALLGALYGRFAALLCAGRANRDYFTAFGVPERRIFVSPHAVDETLFNPSDTRHRAAAEALRSRLGIGPAARVVLFAGKFTAAKQPRALLRAFLAAAPAGAVLVLAGDGEEKAALREDAKAAPPGRVHFLPFANQSEMPARYLMADVFALPSRGAHETWGLAVNEAMSLGVPALVSDVVGCQRDLVSEGETGWVFAAGDEAGLEAAVGRALRQVRTEGERVRLRAAVRERISAYTYEKTSEGLMSALKSLNRP